MDMDSDTMADSDTTARGLLMLRPIPTCFMEDLVTLDLDTPDTSDTMAMDSDIPTMARGLLMLSLRPRLILTITVLVTDLDTPDTSDTPDTLDTSTANRLQKKLSVNHRLDLRQNGIVISLK